MEYLAKTRGWDLAMLALWMDFACIDQDDIPRRKAGVRSLLGYMSRCKFVMIPVLECPKFKTVHRTPGDYGKRAWTRLEALGFYVLSLISNLRKPELYYTAPGGQVGCLDYVLLPYTMPSAGDVAMESDRSVVAGHERVCLEVLHSSAMHGSIMAVGPDLVASAGIDSVQNVIGLLGMRVDVNTADHGGITALWSASR